MLSVGMNRTEHSGTVNGTPHTVDILLNTEHIAVGNATIYTN